MPKASTPEHSVEAAAGGMLGRTKGERVMTNGLSVKAMDHVAIMVSDLERAYHFYSDLLGMEKQEYY